MSRFLALVLVALAAAAAWAVLSDDAARLAGLVALAGLVLLVTGLGVAFPPLRLFGPFVCRGPAGRPEVALTFDDGPDPASTPALLDLLRETGTPAALFCVGEKVDAHPEIVARAVREGHLLGSHTYVHRWNTNLLSSSRLAEEIERAQESIARAAGARPAYFRPPFGLSNPRLFRALRRLGLRAIGWTARGLDTGGATPERVVTRLACGLKPGAILLLHDGGVPADRLLAIVRALLDTLRARGYTVIRLDRLLGDDAPGGDLSPRRHDAVQSP